VYNGKAKSSFGSAGNDMKAIKTRSGNTILLNDSNGSMSLTDPSGGCIKLNGDGTLEICAPNEIILNTKKVTVDATENITMSKDKIIVDVTANTISKKAEEIKMEGTNTNIKTSNTNITSITNIEGDTTVNGTSVTIRGEVNMN
jgi:type VI secretion system secreted protein VgrG